MKVQVETRQFLKSKIDSNTDLNTVTFQEDEKTLSIATAPIKTSGNALNQTITEDILEDTKSLGSKEKMVGDEVIIVQPQVP